MNKIVSFLIARAGWIFAVVVAICLMLAIAAKDISIEAKSTSFFLADDPDLQALFQTEKTFGSESYLVAAKRMKAKPFSEEWLAQLAGTADKLAQLKGVNNVLSIYNAPLFLSGAASLEQGASLAKAEQEIMSSPIFVNNLISASKTSLNFLINASEQLDMNELRALADSDELVLGGMSVIVDRMIAYIKSDLSIYGAALLVLLALAVWWFFGSWYYVFCCVLICALSLLASTGLFALSGYAITVISSNFVPLVLIITISVVIHLLAHFAELAARPSERRLLVRHTLLAKAKPSFYAILTTVVGFLSLVFSGIVPISELGVMMSIGIVLSLVLAYLLMPFLLLHASTGRARAFSTALLAFAASCALRRRGLIYAISVLVIAISALAIPRLQAENSFANYFKDSSIIKRGLVLLDSELGGTLPLDITLDFSEAANEGQNFGKTTGFSEIGSAAQNDADDKAAEPDDEFGDFLAEIEQKQYFLTRAKLDEVARVHNYLASLPHVGSVLSLASVAEFAAKIAPEAADTMGLNALLNTLDERSYAQIIKPYLNEQKQLLRIVVRMKDSDASLRRGEFLERIKRELPKLTHAKVKISGVMVLYNNMLSSLVHSQVDTLSFVIGSIFVLFLIIFRNLRFSVIGIIANVVPLSALFSIIAFTGLRLDLMSITIAAISIGIGVDDIIHYVHRFREEIKRKKLEDAICATHASVGSALFYTTTTVVMGFMLMMSSSFMPTIYFGLLTVLVMILLLCGSLFLLPSLIISWHGRGYFKAEYKEI